MFTFWKKKKPIVYPPEVVCSLEELMHFEFLVQSKNLLPKRPIYSILAGNHASKLRGRGLDFEEVRPYVWGDDIRNIDWLVTARTGKTHSRIYNEEKERPTFVVLDQTSALFFGSEKFLKSVSAAHAAAISAFYTLKRGDRFGGIIFGDDGMDFITPKRSKSLTQYFLQCVVKWNRKITERKTVKSNLIPLNEALRKTAAFVTHDFVITVISDFSDLNEETKKQLELLSAHNDVILIHFFDQMDNVLPDGKLLISDGINQILWQNSSKKQGLKWAEDFDTKHQRLVETFRGFHIPVLYFNTKERIEDQIRRNVSQ